MSAAAQRRWSRIWRLAISWPGWSGMPGYSTRWTAGWPPRKPATARAFSQCWRIRTGSVIHNVAAVLLTLFAGQTFAKEITVRGRLQKTVEAGGWVIVTGNQKYLLLNAQRYQNEQWFTATAEVEAVGEVKTDVMTTYMEGTPFDVRMLRPLAESGSTAAMQSA